MRNSNIPTILQAFHERERRYDLVAMTDIWILSDLHHDFEAFAWPTPPRHDLLVMAGDACDQVHKALRWVRGTAPTQAPILYVPGNHDACTWPLDLVEARSLAAEREGAWRQLQRCHQSLGPVRTLAWARRAGPVVARARARVP